MGGFGNALKDLLGGFNAQRRIDKEGFDWREKSAFDEATRQRAQEEWAQANEDRSLSQIGDVLGGQENPDVESVVAEMPDQVDQARRGWMAKVALGQLPERKSRIESAKAYSQYQRELLKGQQRATEIGQRGDEQQELLNLRYKLEANQPLTPYEQERIRVLDAAVKARAAGGGTPGGRPQLRQVWDAASGKNKWRYINPGEEIEAAHPAAMLQTQGMAQGAQENIQKMVDLADEVTAGPIIGHLSKAWQSAMGPHGKEGEFDFLANALVDTVYIKSGKQINEKEMGILRGMIPDRARGELPEQVRLFKNYARTLLMQYGRYDGEFDDVVSGTPRMPGRPPTGAQKPMVQRNKRTGQVRHSLDGGATWRPGPPQ